MNSTKWKVVKVKEEEEKIKRQLWREGKRKNTIGVIDEGLIVFFEAPRSFTGEDVCELHMHGSIAVCKKVLEVLATMSAVDEKDDGK